MTHSIQSRPFLKWAGNKYRCLDKILPSLPTGSRLIEPFTGSGAVFINTAFTNYLLGEQNTDIINLYKHVKEEGELFINYCERWFRPKNNHPDQYYQYRAEFNQTKNKRRKSALFLYLNRHGFNGLCRYNQEGGYNVPFGQYDKPYFPKEELLHFYHKSQTARFINCDFREAFKLAQVGDVIYCDPPYAPIKQTSNFTSYTSQAFGESEQIQLALLAKEAAENGITVLISNHDTEFTRAQYQDAQIKTFMVKRSISCLGNKRQAVSELLATYHAQD